MENEIPSTDSKTLRLMTIRSEGQFNTVVYEDYDLYRGVERRDVILMHPEDIASRALKPGQRVRVKSEAGELAGVLVHEFQDIRVVGSLGFNGDIFRHGYACCKTFTGSPTRIEPPVITRAIMPI